MKLLLLLVPMFLALLCAADFPEPAKLPRSDALPDPLTALDGTKVETAKAWKEKRAPELRRLFQHYMYGTLPAAPKKVEAKVERTDAEALGGKAVLHEVALTVADAPPMHVLIVLPKGKGPHPVFAGLSFTGVQALLDDPKVKLSTAWQYDRSPGVVKNRATDKSRGTAKKTWPLEEIIGRGYGVAACYNGDIDPDRKEERGGLKKAIDPEGKAGTIAAWAWGVSRIVDHLMARDDVDRKRIIAVGHSRLGKTALLAGAMDERIALAIPHQAGCGGTAPSRTTTGEKVKDINKNFPHWFNAAFKEFDAEPERLPFDQHCLAALMAPRPVLFSNAVKDTWANPDGQFDMLRGADPVYKLLGVEGLASKDKPEVGKPSMGRLGYWVRPGTHEMNADDWKVFLDFADKHLK
ncbi:MAG: acetylxylan esterase [Gemmataceae bacterium]|nr:acetylxylan esterase [Gemmataceae bacterium]